MLTNPEQLAAKNYDIITEWVTFVNNESQVPCEAVHVDESDESSTKKKALSQPKGQSIMNEKFKASNVYYALE